jgi:YgiT-type zinc finger domain-containing protein
MLPGATTVTLERGETIVVIKAVPAAVSTNCGEGAAMHAVATSPGDLFFWD